MNTLDFITVFQNRSSIGHPQSTTLILSPHLRLRLSNSLLFPPDQILYTFHKPRMHSTCSVHLLFLALAILMGRGVVCKTCNFSNLMSPPPHSQVHTPTSVRCSQTPTETVLVLWRRRPDQWQNIVVLPTRRMKWKDKYIGFSGLRNDTWSDIHFRTWVFKYVTACRSDSSAPPNSAMPHFRSLQNLNTTSATTFVSRTFCFNLYHFRSETKDKIWVDLGQECPRITYFHFVLFLLVWDWSVGENKWTEEERGNGGSGENCIVTGLMICTADRVLFGWSNREEWDGREI